MTSVHIKTTNSGECMNQRSNASDKYKEFVITSFLKRAYKVSSNWLVFTKEFDRINQLLTDNNFTQKRVEDADHSFIYFNFENLMNFVYKHEKKAQKNCNKSFSTCCLER